MKKLQFNWEEAEKVHTPERLELMRQYHDKFVIEADWIKLVGALPKKKKYNSQTRSPSSAKHDYSRLKEKFGFFR